jgi:hypothetical protein
LIAASNELCFAQKSAGLAAGFKASDLRPQTTPALRTKATALAISGLLAPFGLKSQPAVAFASLVAELEHRAWTDLFFSPRQL